MNRKQLFTLITTIVASGVVILDGSVVNLALPHISDSFHTGFAGLQWIVDGYLLTLSSLILLGGSLGDILGRKRVYMIGLAGFAAASLLCGLSLSAGMLIALRMVQGVFGALLVPGGLAIINTNFKSEERSAAIGRWTAWSALSAAIGPLVGGWIISVASWRWIFIINVPLIIVCLYLGAAGIKETKDANPRKIDYRGALLAIAALAGITYGLIEGPGTYWSVSSLLPLAGGFIAFALFLWTEHRGHDPMVKLSLFRSRNFTAANIATFAMYGALGGFFFALVIYLQETVGFSSVKAGLASLPVSALLLLLSGRVGKLVGTYGPKPFMTAGPLVAALGMLILLNVDKGTELITGVFPGMILFGLGLALNVAPLTNTVMSSVSDTESGIASGINNAVSRVAGLIVIAMLGLFGAADSYRYTIVLCAAMAAAAGILAFLLVDNSKVRRASSKST
jgi:EmrB/QacA subfamily drug resistance transporter